MQFREKSKKRVNINITSLIDVLFLLLIFFMVSTTLKEGPGITLDLPKTSYNEAVRMEGYSVFMTSDERIYLNDTLIELKNLEKKLREIASEIQEEGLVLQADENIRYGLVVEVMDIMKESGIRKMVIATKIKESLEEK